MLYRFLFRFNQLQNTVSEWLNTPVPQLCDQPTRWSPDNYLDRWGSSASVAHFGDPQDGHNHPLLVLLLEFVEPARDGGAHIDHSEVSPSLVGPALPKFG